MLHALCVEDDDRHADVLAAALHGVAWVQRVAHADEALASLAHAVPDIVFCDVRGTSDAAPLLAASSLRIALDRAGDRVRARIPLVLVSGVDPDLLRSVAASICDTHALPKPFSPRALRELVERLTAPRVGAHPEG